MFSSLDMVRLFLGRYLITKKPFKADKNHFHHVLLKLKWGHWKITLFIAALHLFLIATALILAEQTNFLNTILILLLVNLSFFGVLQSLTFLKQLKRYRNYQKKSEANLTNNELLKNYLYEDKLHIYN
jgi:hypothetical protein